MRADRLISILLLLQQRQTVTAAQVAEELEISVRTARRDLEALAISGVPVYSRHGRGGGWSLVGGATTDLTGLSQGEARALFLAAGTAVGETADLRSAMRKVATALPETFRDDVDAATTAVKVDNTGWGQIGTTEAAPYLELFTQAVIDGQQTSINYESRTSGRRDRIVHPLGLVTKRNVWYLVANTDDGVRTFRLSRVGRAELLPEPVVRPPDFDLDEAWRNIVSAVESQQFGIQVMADVDPTYLRAVRWTFGVQIEELEVRPNGWHRLLIADYSVQSLSAQIAGFGDSLRLVDPPDDVVRELTRIAHELLAVYSEDHSDEHAEDATEDGADSAPG